MRRIALVGDIGSGKTFISNLFGYPVFNADLVVSNLYKKDKFLFRKKQIEQQEKNQRDIDKKAAQDAEIAAKKSRDESARQYDPNIHGTTNYGLGSDGKQSLDSGQGFGVNATTCGPVSNKTGRGRTDYMNGGLASIL